ncbi:MAG TPA: methyltransferase domain-containing protein, partial [Gammaproteobacteria bacterium]|nr:methyltransferase domain-containing protein [Gammaproteobacteria bacterium]
ALTIYELLEPGGVAIISTPYHGYFKNLAISIFNKWDKHFSSLWDGGHIKFFSVKTLTLLLRETGFKNIRIYKAGRIPVLAKSMIAVVEK